jgi:hypothetical protein
MKLYGARLILLLAAFAALPSDGAALQSPALKAEGEGLLPLARV